MTAEKSTKSLIPRIFINPTFIRKSPRPDLKGGVNAIGPDNKTALHISIQEGKLEAAQLLLKYGADPNAKAINGRTPLHIACVVGDFNAGAILIKAGSNVNIQDFELNTPLHYASAYSIFLEFK